LTGWQSRRSNAGEKLELLERGCAIRRAICLVFSLLLGLALGNLASAGTDETVAVGEITGKVLMPDGSPAAGANVRVMCLGETDGWAGTYEPLWTLEARAVDDGTFRLQPGRIAKEKLSGQRYLEFSILATHQNAGFTGTTPHRRGSEVSEPFNLVSLKLNAASTLTGTVTDAGGGPVAQAVVILTGWMPGEGGPTLHMVPEMSPLRVKTRSDGTFTFEQVPKGGRFSLLVQKEGLPDVFVWSALSPVSIAVPKPGSLTGRVVSASAKPVAGCQVWLAVPSNLQPRQPQPSMVRASVVTGADGRFTAAPLFPAAYELRVVPPVSAQDKWAPALVTNQAVGAGETKDLGDIVLTAGGTLSGYVKDAKGGKPLADARVSVTATGARSSVGHLYVKTDADGHYEFRLPAGTYLMYANVSGYASPQEPGQKTAFSVETGGRTESTFELRPVFAVKGRLLLPDGSPAANCTISGVSASNPRLYAQTDGSGRFTLERVTPGEQVDLSASDPEHGARLATSFTVSEDKAEATFTMEKAATCLVTGRVVDDDGKPVPGMQVGIYESAGSTSYQAAAGSTDAQGRFSVKMLQGGQGSIMLGEGGAYITDDLKLQLDSEHVDRGDLVAPRLDQQVAGVVVDIDGEPVANAHVYARAAKGRGGASGRSGSDGKFRLEKLPRGDIEVEAFTEEPDTNILRNQVRQQVPAGTMDVRLVMGIKQKGDVRAAPKAGEPAPELVVEEGAGVTLARLKGKPLVLAFVSIYSRPCVKVLDELKALQEKQGADKLGVTGIHDRTATPEEIEAFRKEHSIPFPIVRVPDAPREGWDSDTFRAYGVTALPTVVRIDAEGKVESVGASLR
jgi:protocatechuate 3,4-dioxygenase beta subunit/peroxiredoxin